jgi:hypothetical protein
MPKLPVRFRLPVLTAAMIGLAASAALGGRPGKFGITVCALAIGIVPTGRKWWEGSLVPLPVRIVTAAVLISLLWVDSYRALAFILCGEIFLEKFLAIRRAGSNPDPGGSLPQPAGSSL